jgi:threonine aldolase
MSYRLSGLGAVDPPALTTSQRQALALRLAAHANAMAARLAAACPFPLAHPVEANGVFVHMDDDRLEALRSEGWFVYRFLDGTVRFMCSWATTTEAVDEIAAALRRIA